MKKLALLLILIITMLNFTACNNNKNNNQSDLNVLIPTLEYFPKNNVISVGKHNEFHYIEYPDYIEITDCFVSPTQTIVEFPSIIKGKPVTSINTSSLQNNTYLKTAIIPNTVTEIGNNLFANCYNLQDITLPSGLKKIGSSSFIDTAWFNCLDEEFVTVGDGILIKYNGKGGDITIPSNVKYISDAFTNNTKIYSVNISSNVTGFSDYAFYNCSSMSEINIPMHISDIGSHTFDETTWLLSITEDFLTVGNGVLINYSGNESEVAIPDNVKYISGAFANTTGIKKITIPNSVKCIRPFSFYNCNDLETIVFEGDNTFIESAAFANCLNLTTINLPSNLNTLSAQMFYSCDKLQNITIPENVTYIGVAVFYNNSELTDICLPKSIKTIDSAAFFGCVKLTNLNLPNTIEYIGDSAFACCYELSDFTLPEKVTTIGAGLFSYCVKLTTLRFGEQITYIGDGAFEGCSALSVYIEGAETILGENIFLNCKGDKYKMYCKKDSLAEKYAKDNKIKYTIIR